MGLFKSLFKPNFELFAGDIILLYAFENSRNINKKYSGYFKYKYGIEAKERVSLLIKNGYLEKASLEQSVHGILHGADADDTDFASFFALFQ